MLRTSDRDVTARLLERAGELLQVCGGSVTQIEELLDLFGHPIIDPSQRLALQEFDRLSQRLADLSLCLTRLAKALDSGAPVEVDDLLAPLCLHDLRLILSGKPAEAPAVIGEAALF
mgnify:CR=1 FL=1